MSGFSKRDSTVYMLERVYKKIKLFFPKAEIIFATTTPVIEENSPSDWQRRNSDIEKYNDEAKKLMGKLGVKVNDLYSVAKQFDESYYADWTHFNEKGARILANEIIKNTERNRLIMKAMLVDENKNLVWSDVEKPSPKEDEILIKIYAAALNRADLLQRNGKYPSPVGWPDRMGLEVSGIIEDMGEKAKKESGKKIGDKVCALLGGGYAEYVCAPYGMVIRMPEGLSFEEAAALPEAYTTCYLNLFYEGHLKEGQIAFIPAGASGLALVAIPMAKSFGARVITSVLSDEIAEKIKGLGADIIINSSKQSVAEVLKAEEENGRPVNMAMDCLCGKELGESLPYMAEGGYWVIISTLAGTETDIKLRPILTKGLHIVGSMLRKRSSEEKAKLLTELTKKLWPKLESGEIKPSVYKVLPIEDAEAAHSILQNGKNVGKVVLSVCKG